MSLKDAHLKKKKIVCVELQIAIEIHHCELLADVFVLKRLARCRLQMKEPFFETHTHTHMERKVSSTKQYEYCLNILFR